MVYKLITPPTELALTVANAKSQLNIEQAFTADDGLIELYIRAAAAHIEKRIQGPLMAQVWEAQLTDFKSCIELKKTFITEINSVKYYNTLNADTAVNPSEYQKDLSSSPARLIFNSTFTQPSVYDRFDAMRINFSAGFSDADAVLPDIKLALCLLITHFYENRSPEIVGGVISKFSLSIDQLLNPHMLWV